MDLSLVAGRVARALRTIGNLLKTGDQSAIGNFMVDCADELDEANGIAVPESTKAPALAKPKHP